MYSCNAQCPWPCAFLLLAGIDASMLASCCSFVTASVLYYMYHTLCLDACDHAANCMLLIAQVLNDLLDPSRANLKLREDPKRGFYVEGIKEETLVSAEHALSVIATGVAHRKVWTHISLHKLLDVPMQARRLCTTLHIADKSWCCVMTHQQSSLCHCCM